MMTLVETDEETLIRLCDMIDLEDMYWMIVRKDTDRCLRAWSSRRGVSPFDPYFGL